MSRPVYAIVLAGGSGTRFWPASRSARPKQLLAIDPTSDLPLIASTVERIEGFCSPEHVLVATGEALLPATVSALPHLPPSSFLGEPVARNTAACIGWATFVIAQRAPDALVMVVPSDQAVSDRAGYAAAVERALRSASTGAITVIGVRPTRPETGYGYIELGEALGEETYAVGQFKEKPDRDTATLYAKSGRHLWNAGMFFFTAQSLLAALDEHLPELARGLSRMVEAPGSVREVFSSLPAVSIDHGLIEKVSGLRVVAAEFGWSDLGSWETAWELAAKDSAGNAAHGETLFVDAARNLVFDLRTARASGLTAVLGVEGLCIVQTDDALLVMPRERAQDVRQVVDALKERGRSELT
jgi:mannose-1-phosphate guanylyltransferase